MYGPTERDPERGVALIMALLVLLLLCVLSAAFLTASLVDSRIEDNYLKSTQLLYVAESGIEDGREALSRFPFLPSATPIIDSKALLDRSGREAGRYTVYLTRANPLTLQSVGRIGASQKTIESRVVKSGFPTLTQAVTLAEVLFVPPTADPQLQKLKTPLGLERLVQGISRNANEIHRPPFGTPTTLTAVGSPADYRIVVVDGDCSLGDVAGFGLLVVRGDLTLYGSFSWNGLILLIGQGKLYIPQGTAGWIEGGLFLARTRDDNRDANNPFGLILPGLGASTIDFGDDQVTVMYSAEEWARANEVFPYVPTSYREY